MDRDTDTLTLLLMDPFLTREEAEREAAAITSWEAPDMAPDLPGVAEGAPGKSGAM